MRWYELYAQGMLHDFLVQKEAIVKQLLPYENVRIYDYQARLDWITDLDNYIDSGHYGPWINDEIIRMIAADQGRVASVAKAQENDAVIIEHVNLLRAAGPDYFAE